MYFARTALKKNKDKNDNVSYLPKWLTSGREIKPEQSIIYRALREYLNRVNRTYEAAENQSLGLQKEPEELPADPPDTTSKTR